MRILIINNISSITYNIKNELKKRGWYLDIFSPYKKAKITEKTISVLRPKNLFDKYLLISTNFKKYDIIHYNYPALINSVIVRGRCLVYKKPFVLHFHGSDLRWKGITSVFRALTAVKTKLAFYATPDLYFRLKWFKGEKIFLPNPVVPLKIRKKIKKYENIILVFTRLEKEKGIMKILKIIKELKEYKFHLINWVSDVPEVTKKLPSNVSLINKIPHEKLSKELSKYKIILGQYSPYGVFGVAELESMSMGIPTFFRWFKKFNNFYHDSVPALEYSVKRIKELMENKKERLRIARKQKRWALKEHSVKKSVRILLDKYEEILK